MYAYICNCVKNFWEIAKANDNSGHLWGRQWASKCLLYHFANLRTSKELTWWQVLACPTELSLFLLESPWKELQGRMGWLTRLGTGASKLSKTGTKQAAREEESPQKHSHDHSRLLWKQWLVNRATLIWDPGAWPSHPIFTITFIWGLIKPSVSLSLHFFIVKLELLLALPLERP